MLVFSHEPLAAKATLTVTISGVGSASQAADAGGAPDQSGGQMACHRKKGILAPVAKTSRLFPGVSMFSSGPSSSVLPRSLPSAPSFSLANKSLWLLPAAETMKKPRTPVPSKKKASPAGTKTVPPTVAAVTAEVTSSLDALKDSIFRLELRRQAGTISEEDYARERAVMEKTLRDLVRG